MKVPAKRCYKHLERGGRRLLQGVSSGWYIISSAHSQGGGLLSESDSGLLTVITQSGRSPREMELTNCHCFEMWFAEGFPLPVFSGLARPGEACSWLRNPLALLAGRWGNGYSIHRIIHLFIHSSDILEMLILYQFISHWVRVGAEVNEM